MSRVRNVLDKKAQILDRIGLINQLITITNLPKGKRTNGYLTTNQLKSLILYIDQLQNTVYRANRFLNDISAPIQSIETTIIDERDTKSSEPKSI
jgi:hypothetical protein